MSLQFITGASGSGKSTYIDQQIIARSEREPEGRFFILVPDQFTMQTQKDLVSLHDRKGIMNIDVLSFGRLTHRIFEEMGANRLPMLDDTGKSLIIRRVAAGQRMELPVLGGRLGQTGYIHEVKSAISEFMQYGIGLQELDQLTEFSKKRGQLYYKLKDLRTIYEGFQQFIREKYLTTEESLEVLASYVPQSKLLKDSVIVFDGFTGFTPVQNRVIAELMKQAKEVIVTVTLGSGENPWEEIREQELFSMSKKTIQTLAKLARDVEIPIADVVEIAPKCSPRFSEKECCSIWKNTCSAIRCACGSLRLQKGARKAFLPEWWCRSVQRLAGRNGLRRRALRLACRPCSFVFWKPPHCGRRCVRSVSQSGGS